MLGRDNNPTNIYFTSNPNSKFVNFQTNHHLYDFNKELKKDYVNYSLTNNFNTPALNIFYNPNACKNWLDTDYWDALLVLFGKGYPNNINPNLSPEFKIFCTTPTHNFYIHDNDRQSLFNQPELYDFPAFWLVVQKFPDYPACIYKVKSIIDSDKKIKNRFSKKGLDNLNKEYHKIKALEEAHQNVRERVPVEQIYKQKVASNFHNYFSKSLEKEEEYKNLNNLYREYNCGDGNRVARRLEAIEQIKNSDIKYTNENYNLDQNFAGFLKHNNINPSNYTSFYGNQLQQVIHSECIDILNQTFSFSPKSFVFNYRSPIKDFVDAACDYNKMGLTSKAMDITDACWAFLDYGKAILEGATEGVIGAAKDMAAHPIQTTLCAVAGEYVLAYQLSKLVFNVAEIGFTALIDKHAGVQKWQEYVAPITQLIDSVYNKQISLRHGIKGATKTIIEWKTQDKLLGGLGSLFRTTRKKAVEFFKSNPLATPENYMSTPDGVLFNIISNDMTTGTQNCSKAAGTLNNDFKAILKDGYYEVNGFKFSKYYYEKLWETGRGAPTLAAQEILKRAKNILPDSKSGFMRYEVDGWEMVYNPSTKEIWHLLQIKNKK